MAGQVNPFFSEKYHAEASAISNRLADGDRVTMVSNLLWRHAWWLRVCGYRVTGDDPRSLGMFISW